jgi:chromosome partitioning protein
VLQAVRRTPTPHLDLITGSMDLANADLALCDKPAREMALKHMLQRVTARYDVIMLDCPPGMSLLTVNALVAANALIIPVMLRYLVVENLSGLAASIETVRSRLGARSRLLGLLLSMMDGRSRGETELRERLRAQFRERIFHTEIPASRALEAAPAAAQPVVAFAPRSTCADAFRRLAVEVLERMRPLRRS